MSDASQGETGRAGWFAPDDLWSLLGWVSLTTVMRFVNPEVGLATASTLVSGMLSIFWLASVNVRARVEHPNLRVIFWAAVAAASLAVRLVG